MILALLGNCFCGWSQSINAYEYWFDMDYVNRVYVSVTSAESVTVANSINTSDLPLGHHTLWFHVLSTDGKWSVPISSPFVKGNRDIIAIEYWYDNDYSTKVIYDLSPTQLVSNQFNIPIGGIAIGNHTISFCFVDEDQLRSVPVSGTFYYDGSVGEILLQSENKAVSLFPNPAKNQISLLGIEEYTHIMIFDQNGKNVFNERIANSTENLNIESYSSGLYSVVLLHPEKCTTMTFVKE